MKLRTLAPIIIPFLAILLFFSPVLLSGKLPIPADTIIGLYHPFRDLYAMDYPNGIPYKNFLITDPVRQQYPWRWLSVASFKDFSLPLWNPYSFAGSPLAANMQSAPYYPLNIFYALLPFAVAWSFLVVLQPLLATGFMYLFLRSLKLTQYASALGALAFGLSGFMIAWLEWNTIGHTGLWLPLLLLTVDKLLVHRKMFYRWFALFIFGLTASLLAGHLQTFFYVALITFVYILLRWFQTGKKIKDIAVFLAAGGIFLFISAVQWIPTLQFILLSARNIDLSWQKDGWFIPWQHLIQFVAPDFFGNPTTLNYWGVWNYGEFIGYVGLVPIVMAIFAIAFRRDRKTYFFAALTGTSLLFALPTMLAKLPFIYNIPFLATAQPTRLLFVTCFALSILSALGLDYWLKKKNKISVVLLFIGVVFIGIWSAVLILNPATFSLTPDQIGTAKRNLYLPTAIFAASSLLLLVSIVIKQKRLQTTIIFALLLLTVFDLVRFANKFTPFTNPAYLFPQTKVLSFLQKNAGIQRVMATDSRLLPPNFQIMYSIQSVNGYDPLYLLQYGELIAAAERGEPNIKPPFGFNRIITPQRYDSQIMDLLGVKYILSLTDITSPKLKKVIQEGETRVYENTSAFPRAFFVKRTVNILRKEDVFKKLFDPMFNLKNEAIVTYGNPLAIINLTRSWAEGNVKLISYSSNKVSFETDVRADTSNSQGYLVLTDNYYPTWKVSIIDTSGNETSAAIMRTNHTFRGIIVPAGRHTVTFYNTLF